MQCDNLPTDAPVLAVPPQDLGVASDDDDDDASHIGTEEKQAHNATSCTA